MLNMNAILVCDMVDHIYFFIVVRINEGFPDGKKSTI